MENEPCTYWTLNEGTEWEISIAVFSRCECGRFAKLGEIEQGVTENLHPDIKPHGECSRCGDVILNWTGV